MTRKATQLRWPQVANPTSGRRGISVEGNRNAAKRDKITNRSTHTRSENGADCWMTPRKMTPRTKTKEVIVNQRAMVVLEAAARTHKVVEAMGNLRKNGRNMKDSQEAGGLKRRGWAQLRKCWYSDHYIRDMRIYSHLRRVSRNKRGVWLYAILPGYLSGKLCPGLITTKRWGIVGCCP